MSIFDQAIPHRTLPSRQLNKFIADQYSLWAKEAGARFDFHLETELDPAEMREHLGRVATWYTQQTAPAQGARQCPADHRYRRISAMQKYIRRGNAEEATAVALGLHFAGYGDHVWKRLAVIASEDIGLADPYATCLVLHMCAYKTWRVQFEPAQSIRAACSLLSNAVKSRDLTDFTVWLAMNCQYPPQHLINELKPTPVLDALADQDRPIDERLWAWWAIFGNMKTVSDKSKRLQAYELTGTPALIAHLAERTKMVASEELGVPGQIIWSMMADPEGSIGAVPDRFPPESDPLVAGCPASAYDKHTWEGKASLKYFVKACEPVRSFLDELDIPKSDVDPQLKQRMDIVGRAVFYTEGGVLDRKVAFQGSQELYDQVLYDKLALSGVGQEETEELLELVHSRLDELTGYRRKILTK